MSRVRTNQITNSAGTGAPNFPNGVTVTGVSTVTGGPVVIGGDANNGTAEGLQLNTSGFIQASRGGGVSALWAGYTQGSSTQTSRIDNDGDATLAKTLTLNSSNTTTGTQFSINKAGGGYGAYFYNDGNSTVLYLNGSDALANITLTGNDGTGTFDGNVRSNEGYVVYPPLDSNYAFATRNAANSTWTAFIEANGKATFAGNVVLSTAGTGIDFSATGDGSGTSTSELLDDYEEGTWTPTTTNFTHTIDATECRYTKIGRMVYLTGQIARNQASTPAADIVIVTGLPYNQSSVTRSISGNYWLDNNNQSDDYMGGLTYSNNTTNIIFAQASTPTHTASSRYIEGNDFDNGRGILFSLTYITD